MNIRSMRGTDADAVLRIYQAGIDSGNASFETTAPTWDAFDAGKLPDHRYVAVDDTDTALGWVTVSPVSSRCVYAGVVEHSVYVDPPAGRLPRSRRPRTGRPPRKPRQPLARRRVHRTPEPSGPLTAITTLRYRYGSGARGALSAMVASRAASRPTHGGG